jgi:hypothetical protein
VVYNYADDNTLSCVDSDPKIVKSTLENACNVAVTWFHANHMKVNPEKFQFMLLQNNDIFSLELAGVTVEPTDTIKLLGVHIDKNLCFSDHVDSILHKGAKQVNALGRLSRQLSESCKLNILDAFIASNFNYCSLAYHHCKVSDACKLERLFKRALRFVYLDFTASYGELLAKAKKCPLYVQRTRLILETVHKIVNNRHPPIEPDFYVRSTVVNLYNLRNTDLLIQPRCNTVKYGYNSLRYEGTILWNSMPDTMKCEDFATFKHNVVKHIEVCQCGFCQFCHIYN